MFALVYTYQGALDFASVEKMTPEEREWYSVRMAKQIKIDMPK